MFRLLRKATILGLAAFGAYRIYELVRPRAEQLAAGAGTQVSGTMDTLSTTAGRVKDDVAAAKDDVVSDLRQGVEEQKDRLTAPDAPAPVHSEVPQVGLG